MPKLEEVEHAPPPPPLPPNSSPSTGTSCFRGDSRAGLCSLPLVDVTSYPLPPYPFLCICRFSRSNRRRSSTRPCSGVRWKRSWKPKKPGCLVRLIFLKPNCEGIRCSAHNLPSLHSCMGWFPGRDVPWVVTTLAEAILRHNGAKTEGIFR